MSTVDDILAEIEASAAPMTDERYRAAAERRRAAAQTDPTQLDQRGQRRLAVPGRVDRATVGTRYDVRGGE